MHRAQVHIVEELQRWETAQGNSPARGVGTSALVAAAFAALAVAHARAEERGVPLDD
jgi:hypothetical protein